jgi:hypothetical protein
MSNLTLSFHTDPGHGWLGIDRATARKILGKSYRRISPYSYQDRYGMLYLEEDCDAGLLLNACKEQGIAVTVNELPQADDESFIRTLRSFRA